MMKKALAFIFLTASFSSHAGLFDSSPELKCGNDNSVNAFKEWIYSDALSQLQDTYIKSPAVFYKIPLATYEKQLQSIPVELENVLTEAQQDESKSANCVAKVSFGVPAATLELVQSLPANLEYITQGDGQLFNKKVVWKNVNFKIQFADNQKDIIVTADNSTNSLPRSMYNMATLAVKKDRLIESSQQSDLSYIENLYKQNDRELNRIWSALPDSIRSGMKKEQQSWVAKKVTTCGKLSDAQSTTLSNAERIKIYQCQNQVTVARIEQLNGEEGNNLPD